MRWYEDTPEVPNWIQHRLLAGGMTVLSVEGFSYAGDQITALFERRRLVGLDPARVRRSLLAEHLNRSDELPRWRYRSLIAQRLGIPLYLVFWHRRVDHYAVAEVRWEANEVTVPWGRAFGNCERLANWLGQLKGQQVRKPFMTRGRLARIDRCLRKAGVPWPGNLDGVIVDPESGEVLGLIEYSRTRRTRVEDHDVNQYFERDHHRWRPLDVLRRGLGVPLLIVIWHSRQQVVKVHRVAGVSAEGLELDRTVIAPADNVVPTVRALLTSSNGE